MSQFIAKPTFAAAYGTDIFVGVIPDKTNVTAYRVLTGGPYRGAIGGNSTFGFWCELGCMRCDAYPPCIHIPRKVLLSLPNHVPILIKQTVLDDGTRRRARFLKLGNQDALKKQLDKFHTDLGGKPCGFHLYAITSPVVYAGKLLAIPVQGVGKKAKKKSASRR